MLLTPYFGQEQKKKAVEDGGHTHALGEEPIRNKIGRSMKA